MTWGACGRDWDDVWYPASEDVRVLSAAGEVLVEVDHEEQLRIIRRFDVGPRGLLLEWERSAVALQRLGAQPFHFAYEPAGSRYQELLSASLRWCAYGSVVMQDFPWTEAALRAVEELRPWHAVEVRAPEWPGTRPSKPAKVIVFTLQPGTIAILTSLARRLYQWAQPNLPEDLCLFRATGEPWLVSIAHESDGWVNLTPEELHALSEAIAPLPLKSPQ